jgi:hypothetical protein
MKKVLASSVILFLIGCASPPSEKIQQTISQNFMGKDLNVVLDGLKTNGYSCFRLKRVENDDRLRAITDGTLKDINFYICSLEDSGIGCVAIAQTNLVSQYDKVIRINGLQEETNCVWN